MKKNCLFYLCMMVCAGIFLASCGKDEEEVSWKEALGTYQTEGNLKLTIDERDVTLTKKVTLAAGTGESAKITLTNIVPDRATLEINNVTMVKDGDKYTFAGEATEGETLVGVKGTLTGVKESTTTLNLSVTRKITSDCAGQWKLSLEAGAIYIDVQSGDQTTDGILNGMVGPMLSGLLAQQVTDVTLTLGEDGKFDVTWIAAGESTPTGMPDAIKALVTIHYLTRGDKFYLALDKALIPLLAAIPGIPEGMDMDQLIKALAEESGDFILLPFNVKEEDSFTTFMVGKDKLSILLPLVAPMLKNLLPPGLPPAVAGLIDQLPQIAATATTFDVGLNFEKK